jgi:hypothetical protein
MTINKRASSITKMIGRFFLGIHHISPFVRYKSFIKLKSRKQAITNFKADKCLTGSRQNTDNVPDKKRTCFEKNFSFKALVVAAGAYRCAIVSSRLMSTWS